MSKVLVLKQVEPVKQEFSVIGATQIGRSDSLDWRVPTRQKPDKFSQLELVLQSDLTDKFVSRNHAGIFREDDKYMLLDLNSLNGTYLNGENINPDGNNPQPVELKADDTLRISQIVFKIALAERSACKHGALLVGAGEDHPGAARNDCYALKDLLEARGYAGNTRYLGKEVTKETFYSALDDFSRQMLSDSHFFFYFHGHGCSAGIKMGNSQIVNPRELYRKIGNIRGRKAVFIEGCNAGSFLNENNKKKVPDNTLVVVACGENYGARETSFAQSPGYRGMLAKALCDFIEDNAHTFNLAEFERVIKGELGDAVRLCRQGPKVHRHSFTVMSLYMNPPSYS